MKLFPYRKYKLNIRTDFRKVKEHLETKTEYSDSLVSLHTKKRYIGQVYETGFNLISSIRGFGALCVLIGNFNGRNGVLEVKLHPVFKVLFSILLLMPIVGWALILINQGLDTAIQSVGLILIGIFFVRFVFLGLTFNIIASSSLERLEKDLSISSLKKE